MLMEVMMLMICRMGSRLHAFSSPIYPYLYDDGVPYDPRMPQAELQGIRMLRMLMVVMVLMGLSQC